MVHTLETSFHQLQHSKLTLFYLFALTLGILKKINFTQKDVIEKPMVHLWTTCVPCAGKCAGAQNARTEIPWVTYLVVIIVLSKKWLSFWVSAIEIFYIYRICIEIIFCMLRKPTDEFQS